MFCILSASFILKILPADQNRLCFTLKKIYNKPII